MIRILKEIGFNTNFIIDAIYKYTLLSVKILLSAEPFIELSVKTPESSAQG